MNNILDAACKKIDIPQKDFSCKYGNVNLKFNFYHPLIERGGYSFKGRTLDEIETDLNKFVEGMFFFDKRVTINLGSCKDGDWSRDTDLTAVKEYDDIESVLYELKPKWIYADITNFFENPKDYLLEDSKHLVFFNLNLNLEKLTENKGYKLSTEILKNLFLKAIKY
ncbi:MAG: hypothetical protein K0B02_03040 [DPANN group archaeon]|nr:hypothetical protein [DPANN group archaeon]